MAAGSLRIKIGQRMQQITQFAISNRFLDALEDALATPTQARYLMSADNLQALGVRFPSEATYSCTTGGGTPGLAMSFHFFSLVGLNCGFPLPPRDTLRSAMAQRMPQFTQFVTNQAFCNALQQVLCDWRDYPDPSEYARAILGGPNLRTLGVPIPSGMWISSGVRQGIESQIALAWTPVIFRFNYPD